MRLFICYIIFLLMPCGIVCGQGFTDQQLRGLEDEELLSLFNEVGVDSIKQERIARVYLNRARSQKDTIKMARGYDRLARIFHPEKNIQFADSVIALTKDIEHITYPALGYMLKGFEFNELGDLVSATESFLSLYELSLERNNVQQQLFALYYLIYFKTVWGDKNEALNLQRKRHGIILGDNYKSELKNVTRQGADIDLDQLYLNDKITSYENYILCFLKLKQVDSARYYLNYAFTDLEKYNWVGKDYHSKFLNEAEVELLSLDNKYHEAVALTAEILSEYKSLSQYSKMKLFFWRGLSFIELDKNDQGIKSLKISDSIYSTSTINLEPSDRQLFELLHSHYKRIGDIPKQIEYLNKMIYIDSIFTIKYQYFEPNLIKNFETPRLLAEKEALISSLTKKNQSSSLFGWTSAALFLVSLTGLFYYFKRQKVYKKRFVRLMEQGVIQSADAENIEQKNKISSEVINTILEQLDAFESSNQFISQDISLNELAKAFGTNSRYLSRIINLEKEKNFSHYINDLRLEFAFQKLSDDDIFRRYTIKAIANDCGFNRAEVFSKAFYRKYKIYPSFYIKQLEEHVKKR